MVLEVGGVSRGMTETQSNAEPSLRTYRQFLRDAGVSSTTGWRWQKKGWIRPVNIAGRLYVTAEMIAEFRARATSGEFAKAPTGAAQTGRPGET
jgi:hypothetical protein